MAGEFFAFFVIFCLIFGVIYTLSEIVEKVFNPRHKREKVIKTWNSYKKGHN